MKKNTLNKHLFQLNTPKLKYLSIEKNKITNFLFVYSMLLSPNLVYINMNQNKLQIYQQAVMKKKITIKI